MQCTHPPVTVPRFRWLLLAALALALLGSTLWACLARVPESVESMGILLYESGIGQVHSLTAGQVARVAAVRGQSVQAGDILVELQLPQSDVELELAQEKLRALVEVERELQSVANKQFSEEERISSLKSTSIRMATQSIEKLAANSKSKTTTGLDAQSKAARELTSVWQARLAELTRHQESVQKLISQQLATKNELAAVESQIIAAKQTLGQLDQQLQSLELQRLEADRTDVEWTQRLEQFDVTEQEIDLSLKRLRAEQDAQISRSRVQIDSQRMLVDQLLAQKERMRYVRATHAGQILEVPVEVGQPIGPGSLVSVISRLPEDGVKSLVLSGFFPLGKGKRICLGQEVFVTPTTLERERHGSLRGTVSEQHAYPISTEEAMRLVGNRDLLGPLSGQGGVLGIKVTLETDHRTGDYRWTSTAPDTELSVGTTARVQVVVERRAPITYLFPALREWIYGPDQPLSIGESR